MFASLDAAIAAARQTVAHPKTEHAS